MATTSRNDHEGEVGIEPERMQCMEVWGGNQAVDRSFETPGLYTRVFSQPFGEAAGGGDVYYLSSCASGRITRLMLADVSGHGEVVSQVALRLRDLMRQNINFIKQTRFVRQMNQQFAQASKIGGFATAIVATFFAPTRQLTICNAGHPPPLHFDHASNQWSELVAEATDSPTIADTPLGIVGEATYRELSVQLNPGDLVLCFSDAVTESMGTDGRQLGRDGVLQILRDLPGKSPAEVIPRVVDRIRSVSDDNLRQDDSTLILCEATGRQPSLKSDLGVPLRLLSRVNDRTTVV